MTGSALTTNSVPRTPRMVAGVRTVIASGDCLASLPDTTTYQGKFDATLRQGTLAVVSGKIAKQSPEAMTVRTPATILGVRGTEFVISAEPVKLQQ